MVELRKRKAPPPGAAKTSKKPKGIAKSKAASTGSQANAVTATTVNTTSAATAKDTNHKIAAGERIEVGGFGGEVTTSDGTATTLAKLLGQSKSGVILFTYPKASTPGCTTQACLFRDSYTPLTSTGFDIYGLSTDSPKANDNFRTKQDLPYTLLCDPKSTLISAIGLKKSPTGTQRGVFAVDKDGKILLAEAGGPAATVEAAKNIVLS